MFINIFLKITLVFPLSIKLTSSMPKISESTVLKILMFPHKLMAQFYLIYLGIDAYAGRDIKIK